MIYRVLISLFLFTFMGWTNLFFQDSLNIPQEDKISESGLPALKIDGDYYTPDKGVDISVAKDSIIAELTNEGIQGDIGSVIKITEITTREAWQNMGIQLYQVILDYAWIDGVAIIKNKKVQTILKGMQIEAVFLADLDKDNIYEIYTNYFMGSGAVSEDIFGYNISLDENYCLSMRLEKDLHLYIANGILMAGVRPYNEPDEKPIIKKVNLKKFDNKYKLIIE
jgi:hypothetical protein